MGRAEQIDTATPDYFLMRVSITLLSYDHGILREALDVLEEIADCGTWEEHRDILPEVDRFLQRFMDQYHHGKEERFVFPVAQTAGPPRLKESIADLIEEHDQAKAFADAISRSLADWNIEGLRINSLDLVAHMRHHIEQEENFVFPELENILDPDQDLKAHEDAQRFMEENFGASFQADMEQFANRLQDKVMGKGVIKYSV